MKHYLLSLLLSLTFLTGYTQSNQQPEGVYLIFDASGSMWGRLANSSMKIEAAKKALKRFISGDFHGKELALRVYGHRREKDCSDTELVIPFGPLSEVAGPFVEAVQGIQPKGRTPISRSFRAALEDFGDRPGTIILISDGIETCDEDPCALMREWREKNVQIVVHVVGFGADEKTKSALKCIAEEAGTPYHDAGSTEELVEGLSEIQEKPTATVLEIQGVDAAGEVYKIEGKLMQEGQEKYTVESHFRNHVQSGTYTLIAGIMTKNGTLYLPVSQEITLPPDEVTSLTLEVMVPPSVKAQFTEIGEDRAGSQIYAFQDGEEAFSFRWRDEVFLEEGTYEFRTKPNDANELSLTETFGPGDHKTLVFELQQTVHARIKMVSSAPQLDYRENYELWQNGERKYKVHWSNGVIALPGTYDLHLTNSLTPYIHKDLVITTDEEQDFRIEVPSGHVTFIYLKADGSRDKDDRCFVSLASSKSRKYHTSGRQYALTPGTYRLTGWTHKGTYEAVEFEVKVGEEKEVELRKKF